MDRASWSYVSGWISTQSERLMAERDFLGLLNAPSDEERLGRLRASLLFSNYQAGDAPGEEIEQAFAGTVRAIADISPDKRIADLFLREREWHAFRQFAKNKVLHESDTSGGSRDRKPTALEERFAQCWNGRAEVEEDRPFAEAATQIISEVPSEGDRAGWIDGVIDAYEAAALIGSAEDLGSADLIEWVRVWVRLRIALSLVRARRIDWPAEEMLLRWQALGFDEPEIADAARCNEAEWPALFDRLGLPSAQESLNADESTVKLARQIDNRVATLASASSGIPFGPEKVFAFLWSLRAEAKNLKLILSAATFGVAENRVAAELRMV